MSAHTIGQSRSPYPVDRQRRWIGEAWRHAICRGTRYAGRHSWWFTLPATSQLTLTTRNLMDHYRNTCNPFDFLAVAQYCIQAYCGAASLLARRVHSIVIA